MHGEGHIETPGTIYTLSVYLSIYLYGMCLITLILHNFSVSGSISNLVAMDDGKVACTVDNLQLTSPVLDLKGNTNTNTNTATTTTTTTNTTTTTTTALPPPPKPLPPPPLPPPPLPPPPPPKP